MKRGLLLLVALRSLAVAQENVVPVEPVLPPAPTSPQQPPPQNQAPDSCTPGAVAPGMPPGAVPPAATDPILTGPPPGFYQSMVRAHKPSPVWTQDRNFSTTRFWVIDPGEVQVETWAYSRIYPEKNGVRAPASMRFFQEIEIGVAPHLQLDLYGDFHYDVQDADKQRHLSFEAWRAELRIAIPNHYGQIPTNPVIYLEWIGIQGGPSRAEVRLLLGGAPTRWLFLAANPYYEVNMQQSTVDVPDAVGASHTRSQGRWLEDAEAGTTLAAGFKVADWLSLSVQAKIGVDMLGDANNKYHFVFWAGPGFIVKPLPVKYRRYLKIIGSALFLIPGSDTSGGGVSPDCYVAGFAGAASCYDLPQQVEPTLIVGSQF